MWLGRMRDRLRWDGTTGTPRSSNAASSFHLQWVVARPPAGRSWVAAEAVLEVLVAPAVPMLSFWALQASFVERGRHHGAGHLGLQWYPPHPGSTAVNWGGYDAAGHELTGSSSPLPSATGNVNTRDLAWSPGVPYRLRISRAPSGRATPAGRVGWRGQVTDLRTGQTTIVRELWAGGGELTDPVVWSEVFARCDDPSASVRWTELRLIDDTGAATDVSQVRVNYQAVRDGGCTTTDSAIDGAGFVQTTGTARVTSQGQLLVLPHGDRS